MRLSRLYLPLALQENTEILLPKEAHHYISHVLRINYQQSLIVFNGQGGEYLTEVYPTKKETKLYIKQFIEREVESSLQINLLICMIRNEKLDLVIQKAVELGVVYIYILPCKHSIIQLNQNRMNNRLEHWQKIIQSACEQCGRNRLPTIEIIHNLSDIFLKENIINSIKLLFIPTAEHSLKDIDIAFNNNISLWIGPEGGVSPEEYSFLEKHQFKPILLGRRILRAETAAVSALTLVQGLWGDLA